MAATVIPGQLIDVTDVGSTSDPKLLLKCDAFRLMRLVLPKGKELPTHTAPKQIVVQCVSGRVDFTALEKTHAMTAGSLLYLDSGEPHALVALEDSVMLVTLAN
ncbi:cupin domain-containing protein [Planctomycetes bacterium K23_9]|uniref:Cupin domain protein n=1 Tax=Stieleria marina TaxID=1930275 RepID=A0A517NRU0_9BACT|nr:Cupin domain protein [Planctomycetes bacterium K23_9]